jgi:hypothetical protein
VLFVLAMTVAGCGNGSAPTVTVHSPADTQSESFGPTAAIQVPTPTLTVDMQSAVDTAQAFLQVMGDGDQALMNAYLVPSLRSEYTADPWMDTPPPHRFQNLDCRFVSERWGSHIPGASVIVGCEFDVRMDRYGRTGGHIAWTVSLQRQPPGPWLVDNYGAG